MSKLVLNEVESLELQRDGAVEIVRNGFYILVEQEKDYNGGTVEEYDFLEQKIKEIRK